MALYLYRRHRPDCEAGHPTNSRSSEVDERRKGWRRCRCVIHVSGTLAGQYARRATHQTTWEEALTYVAPLRAAASWDALQAPTRVSPPAVAVSPAPPSQEHAQAGSQGVPIANAIGAFLIIKAATVAPSTYRKYVTFTTQLSTFAESLGYVLLDQFRPGDIDQFYARSTLGPRSKAKMLERLRGFFRFAVYREWLPKSPVSGDLKPPRGSTTTANKVPFTDEQLADILRACDQLEDQPWGNRYGAGIWTGEDLKEFIWLLVYTGLRISDAVLFDVNRRVQGNEVYLRAAKNGGDVFVWIPDWLRDRLQARVARYGPKIFWMGRTTKVDTMTDTWRQRLAKVFALADVGEERATPHRFRHTFARILLQRGVPVADVADLLGDDEATVRKHYARWVPERQARLTSILKAAFGTHRRIPPRTVAQGRSSSMTSRHQPVVPSSRAG